MYHSRLHPPTHPHPTPFPCSLFLQLVGFVPTGWLYEMKRHVFSVRRKGASQVHLVPYSEHSSFAELLEFVGWMRPHQVSLVTSEEG